MASILYGRAAQQLGSQGPYAAWASLRGHKLGIALLIGSLVGSPPSYALTCSAGSLIYAFFARSVSNTAPSLAVRTAWVPWSPPASFLRSRAGCQSWSRVGKPGQSGSCWQKQQQGNQAGTRKLHTNPLGATCSLSAPTRDSPGLWHWCCCDSPRKWQGRVQQGQD